MTSLCGIALVNPIFPGFPMTTDKKGENRNLQHTESVRIARLTDVPAIASVHVVTWQAIYRGIMVDRFLDTLRSEKREPMWNRVLSEGRGSVHVACVFQELVGFSYSGSNHDTPAAAEIFAIYVHPDHWGKGLGRVLFSASCEAMRGRNFEHLVLWVATRNTQARTFYERVGMKPDGGAKTVSIGGVAVEEMRYFLAL